MLAQWLNQTVSVTFNTIKMCAGTVPELMRYQEYLFVFRQPQVMVGAVNYA
jgi:hypothetical protein